MEKIADGLIWYIIFLFSTTLHEAAHSFVSMRLGDYTAYHGGQVSLSPVPHIKREPFGTVVVPILTFFLGGWMMGWASAPYNAEWAYNYPKKSAAMALAGPASNLIILLFCAIGIKVGIAYGFFYAPESINFSNITRSEMGGIYSSVAKFLSIGFSLNLILFLFNLIPVPPLDGSGIVKFFLSDDLARRYMKFIHQSGVAFLGIILAWNLFDYVYSPVLLLALNLLYPGSNYQ